MTDPNAGTYCTWCGQAGGFMWTMLRPSKTTQNLFVHVGGTVHWKCLRPWLMWITDKLELELPPGGEIDHEEPNDSEAG